MDLSICILTYCQPELLPKCVESCFAEVVQAGITAEVIVVDNGSTDGAPNEIGHTFPQVRIIRSEQNLGFAAGNNEAIRNSHGSYVLILNDDATLQPGSLQRMVEKLKSDPGVGAVGPRLVNPDGSPQRGFTNRRFPRLRSLVCGLLGLNELLERKKWTRDLLTHSRDLDLSGETDHIAGACLLVRRDVLNTVGLFDEGFYYWFEDADLCYRIKKAGWKIVYLAEARVTHYGSASIKSVMRSSERRRIYLQSLKCFSKKHLTSVRHFPLRIALSVARALEAASSFGTRAQLHLLAPGQPRPRTKVIDK
jgi:GT2 family glycosyltransferase